MRNIDITTLRSFMAVADQGGVTRAAGYLNLTQSAVSMQLKRLEESLDAALIDRTGRKVSLTGEGELLLTYARRMVALNDEVVGRLMETSYEGELILGVPHDIVYPQIPQILKRFNAAYPRVKVHLKSSSTVKLHEARAGSGRDHHLAGRGAAAQKLKPFARLLKRQHVADMGFDLAGLIPRKQRRKALRDDLGPEL